MTTVSAAPDHITQGYMRAFHALHGRPPRIKHLSGDWYKVNGEIVHRSTVEAEIEHLQTLARKHRRLQKGVVQRLIARLRSL